MPPLHRPAEIRQIILPARNATVAARADVLVVGGGPAGLGAALGAAAAGAKVVLAERYGFLGGNATAALVMPWMSSYTQQHAGEKLGDVRLMPTDHGGGEPVIGGVHRELLENLVRAGGAIPPSRETGFVVPFDPEVLKLVALDMLDQAGVKFLLHALATEVIGQRQVQGVVFETKSGPVVIEAETVVDCTGDGDVAAQAGAPYKIGRDPDGLVQPMTLMFRMVQFQRAAFEGYVKAHPDQWHGVYGLWDLVKRATAAGELTLTREDILLFGTPHAEEVAINSTRVTRVLGVDVWDLTYAEWESRRQLRQVAAFLRKYVPGFANSYVAESGATIGVRETRQIQGEYTITVDDLLGARKFDDVIARGAYPVDIHSPTGKGTTLKRLPPGEAYDLPLRSLLPQGVEQLLVAGRCISGTHEAMSSYRVSPIAMATGHAAGVCAALAAQRGKPPRQVPAADVQGELIRQGADLGR